MVWAGPWRYLVETLAETRIQLCGRFAARIDGRRVEQELPGRQGRLAFAYLVAHRYRPVTRDELIEALWGTSGGSERLSPVLSKLRGSRSARGTRRPRPHAVRRRLDRPGSRLRRIAPRRERRCAQRLEGSVGSGTRRAAHLDAGLPAGRGRRVDRRAAPASGADPPDARSSSSARHASTSAAASSRLQSAPPARRPHARPTARAPTVC